MNGAHRLVCGSRYWRRTVREHLLPWVLTSVPVTPHVVEIGPGPGAATEMLLARAHALTCIEIDPAAARRLVRRYGDRVQVYCQDAAAMSVTSKSSDLVVAMAVLHHVPTGAHQDRILFEVSRILRPGGLLVGYEISANPIARCLHWGDTMTLMEAASFPSRLWSAGFVDVELEVRSHGFRFRARAA